MAVTPDDAIEAIRASGGAQPGYRALHAKGTLYHGRFTASPEAATLSRAKHLDGSSVPALFRFSNGPGNPKTARQRVRGAGVGGEVEPGPTGRQRTCRRQTARLFVSSTPDGFVDLLKAMRPGPAKPLRMAAYLATHPRLLWRTARPARRQQDSGKLRHRRVSRTARVPLGSVPTAPPASSATTCTRWRVRSSCRGGLPRARIPTFCTTSSTPVWPAGRCGLTSASRSPGPTTRPADPSAPWRSTETVPSSATSRSPASKMEREHGGDIVVFDPDAGDRRHRTVRRRSASVPHVRVFGVGQAPLRRGSRRRSAANPTHSVARACVFGTSTRRDAWHFAHPRDS